MRRILVISATLFLGLATSAWGQQRTAPVGGFGRIMFPGGNAPGAGVTSAPPGVTGVGFPATGRIVYPGTAAPAISRPGAPLFLGTNLPTIDHDSHQRTRPGPSRVPVTGGNRRSNTQIVPFPVFYGGGYYAYDPPSAQLDYDYVAPVPQYGEPQEPASPVVIINQYFEQDASGAVTQRESVNNLDRLETQSQTDMPAQQAAVTGGILRNDDISRLFLIALTDSTILTASAYWVEDDTLNYITTSDSHNRVSMRLVNRELSQRLNDQRDVAFGLPSN